MLRAVECGKTRGTVKRSDRQGTLSLGCGHRVCAVPGNNCSRTWAPGFLATLRPEAAPDARWSSLGVGDKNTLLSIRVLLLAAVFKTWCDFSSLPMLCTCSLEKKNFFCPSKYGDFRKQFLVILRAFPVVARQPQGPQVVFALLSVLSLVGGSTAQDLCLWSQRSCPMWAVLRPSCGLTDCVRWTSFHFFPSGEKTDIQRNM